jgi:hypothetical protein
MQDKQIENLKDIMLLFESGTISKEEMEKLKKDVLATPIQNAQESGVKVKNPRDYSFRIFLLVLFSLLITVIFAYRREISNAIWGNEERFAKSDAKSSSFD